MIPLRDDIPARRFPIVNYVLIGLCIIVYLLQVAEESGASAQNPATIVDRFAMIPARLTSPEGTVIEIPDLQTESVNGQLQQKIVMRPAVEPPMPAWMTLFSCMFLHGSFMHLAGNMLFLFVFGDNVEDRFGHLGYVVFYGLSGLGAGLLHLMIDPESAIPTLGASGAIAGVMGGYMLLYPKARVLTLIPLGFIITTATVPAPWMLGIWFAIQLVQGASSLTVADGGGVAWWAHVGGFVVGAAIAGLCLLMHTIHSPVEQRRYLQQRRW